MTGCDIGDNNYVSWQVCVCVCGGGGLCLQVCHGLCMYVHVHMGTADLRGSTCKQTLHSNRGHLRGGQRTLIFHSF